MDLTEMLKAIASQGSGKTARRQPAPVRAAKSAPTLPDNVQVPDQPEQAMVFLAILALALEQMADTESEYNTPIVVDFKLREALMSAELSEPIKAIGMRLELGGFIRTFSKPGKRGSHTFYVPVCLSQDQPQRGARSDRGARSSSFLRSLKDLETRLANQADKATGTEG